jgi:tRNA-splicing ligase RtcB
VKTSDKLHSLVPLEEIEQGALQQIFDNLGDDRVLKMAIMPDVHQGYDLPIGGVALVDGHICPSYVGYDIGCGMCAVNTGVLATDILPDRSSREHLFKEIYRAIPVGLGGHRAVTKYPAFRSALADKKLADKVNKGVTNQLGTLGSGNHFIEISSDRQGLCWVTLHSGSRNAGHTVGSVYMAHAKRNRDRFLALEGELGQAYLYDMSYCLDFALENRRQMMADTLGLIGFADGECKRLLKETMINENHNHAVVHDDGTVLHRKGATPAEKGQLGIIPANMRDGIFITRGLGNERYLNSASHGAGRVMSRSWGRKTVPLKDFKETMQGIVARVDRRTLDESPFVYKDINKVIETQEGVVIEVVTHLKPLVNVKG